MAYYGRIRLFTMLSLLGIANAAIQNTLFQRRPLVPQAPIPYQETYGPNGVTVNISTVYYFDQLIDHSNPSLGTFQQRYWTSNEFYQTGVCPESFNMSLDSGLTKLCPVGGPVILMTPGEVNADGYQSYLTNETVNGMIAQQQNGATVVVEHRFFGFSNPYDNLTSQSLEVHTVEQAVQDLVYFAQNVDLPWQGGDSVKPDKTPWVLVGGSYSGALTSWTMVSQPGVFYAGYASSGVVEAITDYYGYYTPIREYMPQNCSADVEAVISFLDGLYGSNNQTGIQALKEAFGVLGALAHTDDFAAALQGNLFNWVDLQPYSGGGQLFFEFCDALEVKDGISAGTSGWGLDHAIEAWGNYWNTTYYSYVCGTADAECNEVGYYYQNGPPEGQPAIVSRILQPVYQERLCVNYFPDKFSTPLTPAANAINAKYGGWNVNVDRLFFANALRDPWREATVSADGLNKENTTTQPIYESDGFHCSDLLIYNGVIDATILTVQEAGLAYMKEWLEAYGS
ncbi:hypothetical protein CONPUDRAFT_155499 [Coniophora puteana RWD-64-598 SS2]|uniref:Peptidase S28 n=1 Tax=Coniophora puteana (strain RWD-64-598) TaxID=741705 RepID=A0A5M3MHR3_CONPW|nr:uncharacterized protein CONPUDRAFT_155499 [Coniophora puteana RWD-64-598 SS2]EIW78768.1 hypothetical protein CONPUDRAFT_155499 [Coniophora puteana RWD-64-598 SS2]